MNPDDQLRPGEYVFSASTARKHGVEVATDQLRRAATLIRERAENSAAARIDGLSWSTTVDGYDCDKVGSTWLYYQSWRPGVGLALSDWLVGEALAPSDWNHAARAVAAAYLNEPPGT